MKEGMREIYATTAQLWTAKAGNADIEFTSADVASFLSLHAVASGLAPVAAGFMKDAADLERELRGESGEEEG